jgi:hypothetical protein
LAGAVVSFILLGTAPRAWADDVVKVLDSPGGGEIVYGPLEGVASLSGAMVDVLRTVHEHFDDRPRVGKFLQARDGHSVATFFSVTDKSQGGRAFAGLAIVSLAEGSSSAAGAVLYDDAARFAQTEPAMMKTLGDTWHLSPRCRRRRRPRAPTRSVRRPAPRKNGKPGPRTCRWPPAAIAAPA